MPEESYTVAGIQYINFKGKDSEMVRGKKFFLSKAIDPKQGEGVEFVGAFFSDSRLASMAYKPAVGDTVEVLYNRYGKVYLLRPVVTVD